MVIFVVQLGVTAGPAYTPNALSLFPWFRKSPDGLCINIMDWLEVRDPLEAR